MIFIMKIKRFPVGVLWTNCYLVWDSQKRGFFVDPGGDASELGKFACNNDIMIDWVIITHGHIDHIAGLATLRNLAENGVAIHEKDADCLTNSNHNLSEQFVGQASSFLVAEKTLRDGEVLHVGSMSIKVIHTPGHTRGGICLLVSDGDEEFLLSGDTLFASSVGRTDLPGGDYLELKKSLKKLYDLSDDLIVYPGHGPETTIGEEKKNNQYFNDIE